MDLAQTVRLALALGIGAFGITVAVTAIIKVSAFYNNTIKLIQSVRQLCRKY
jgi:hypothetical protein